MASPALRGSPVAVHVVALVTVFAYGCATVRAPVSGIDPTVPVHGSTAEPQLELWLESGSDPTPAESSRAAADAREALHQALQDRKLGEDEILVVRAQAVSRTDSRRTSQHAAIAGIVVGAVALVALAIVASRGRGGVPRVGGHAGRAGGGFRPGVVPPPVGGGFRPGATPPRPVSWPAVPPRGVASPHHPGGATVEVDVRLVTPVPSDAPPAPEEVAAEPFPVPGDVLPPPPAAEERITVVTLPAPSPLSLQNRGFFDGDWLRLELFVVDARTGAVRWAKAVADEVDIRDAGKVRQEIDDALSSEEGWYVPWFGAR